MRRTDQQLCREPEQQQAKLFTCVTFHPFSPAFLSFLQPTPPTASVSAAPPVAASSANPLIDLGDSGPAPVSAPVGASAYSQLPQELAGIGWFAVFSVSYFQSVVFETKNRT